MKVRRAERLERLLAVMILAYIILIVLGAGDIGKCLRKEVEIVRKKCRHGTTRTLSVLSMALMAITDTFLLSRRELIKTLVSCLRDLTNNFFGRVVTPCFD